ncbi:tetratricopeptide repeat protein [Streptomyces sp. NPDC000594]|uniref:tetratricopeptide repeat protein n=1 Tax=Streptomyces sp. NPDC000594 TaxID=3154261 RepID=UPI0033262E10
MPNPAFRRLRGPRSPGEFATAVRRAAREIGEQVSCDARYIGRVESGEIRCPNYAYERVFRHMYPGLTLTDLGFAARETVRGGGRRRRGAPPSGAAGSRAGGGTGGEEGEVLRREFITSGPATAAAASLGAHPGLGSVLLGGAEPGRRAGEPEVAAVEEAVRRIRLLDDRHGAEGLHRRAARPLRAAYALLDSGISARPPVLARLHSATGALALSVGWLAHDSGRPEEARSHYGEALAIARAAGDPGLEAHAFANISMLARSLGRHREAVRAAEAGARAAPESEGPLLPALLALREAGGRAGLGDRGGCERALSRAHHHFERGGTEACPEWMSFFGRPELEALQARCLAMLGEWHRAAGHLRTAVRLQNPHFARNLAMYGADQALTLTRCAAPDESAAAAHRVLDLVEGGVRSARVDALLASTATALRPHRRVPEVAALLTRRTAFGGT